MSPVKLARSHRPQLQLQGRFLLAEFRSDGGGDGMISRTEFDKLMADDDAKSALIELDVDPDMFGAVSAYERRDAAFYFQLFTGAFCTCANCRL